MYHDPEILWLVKVIHSFMFCFWFHVFWTSNSNSHWFLCFCYATSRMRGKKMPVSVLLQIQCLLVESPSFGMKSPRMIFRISRISFIISLIMTFTICFPFLNSAGFACNTTLSVSWGVSKTKGVWSCHGQEAWRLKLKYFCNVIQSAAWCKPWGYRYNCILCLW